MNTALNEMRTAQFGADGVARIRIGPQVYGTKWNIRRVAIQSTSATKPVFTMYRNSEQISSFVDGSKSGNSDSSETDIELLTLDQLICVWHNGTPGSYAAVSVQGRQDYGV